MKKVRKQEDDFIFSLLEKTTLSSLRFLLKIWFLTHDSAKIWKDAQMDAKEREINGLCPNDQIYSLYVHLSLWIIILFMNFN